MIGTHRPSSDDPVATWELHARPVSISDDGNLVAFSSGSTDVVGNDTNGTVRDVFVRNMSAGQTNVVSTNAAGERSSLNASGASISGDGRYIAFTSFASNLVPGDTNDRRDVFVLRLKK